ncbi:MAG: nucleotide exchange factor GrpE [Pseudomonadota bacterium]
MDEEQELPAEPQAEIEPEAIARALQAVLEEKEKEIAGLKDQMLRALAEADNTRRRTERELADMSKYAVTGFARDLVSVLENLQRALDSIPAELKETQPTVANLATGVEMTLNELLGIFNRQGIQRIDPMGQKFDHNLHQAVAQIDTPDAVPGTVVQVLQAGYVIHDRLLRPAMVGVAAASNPVKAVDTSA